MMREVEIERQFGIKIENIKPNKGVYFLKTNHGMKCLKKINYGIQKLLFVYGAKEHLINNGFARVDKYDLNVEGNPYAIINEDIYTLSEWIEGRECDFHNNEDLQKAAENLALLHIASKGYEPPDNSKLKTDLGRWYNLMTKRVKSFDKMRDMIRKKSNKSEFDLYYLKNVDFYKELGRNAINILETSYYNDLCNEAENDKSFCHHDYTYNNIVIDKNNEINVIDFDYCKREIRVYDISNYITKVLKRNEWNIDFAKLIINSYNSVSKISDKEYRVLYAFLVFPQRFWRLCNRYYYNEVTWTENIFKTKIEELVGENDKYMKFINDFKNEYAHE